MIRLLILLVSVALLAGCKNASGDKHAENNGAGKSRYAAILAKCKNMNFDTLAVYSSSEPDTEDEYPFRGVRIDSLEGMFLPGQLKEGLASELYGTYACGAFPIDGTHTGIILRAPAEYSSNSISLLLLDKTKDTITDVLELAQLFGDAGDFVEKKSWLYKNPDNQFSNFMWVVQTYDHSVQDASDSTIERQDNYYRFDLNRPFRDTASKEAKDLFKTFEQPDRK